MKKYRFFCYEVLRLKPEPELAVLRFDGYDQAQKFGGVKLENYCSIMQGTQSTGCDTLEEFCEELYHMTNGVRLSDIVIIKDKGFDPPRESYWFCDYFGFRHIDRNGNVVAPAEE